MYSDAVLDHFKAPRNVGELADASARAEVSNPVCGDVLQLSVRAEDGRVTDVRFRAQGCVTAVACASVLTELMQGKNQMELGEIRAEMIAEALGGLPPTTVHGSVLAADAVAEIAARLSRGRKG